MRETDIIPKGIVKRQKSTFEPLASSLKSHDSSRAGELGIRRAFTETKTIRAKVGGSLREVLITVMRDSLPASAVRKKPPDIEIPLEHLKICSEKPHNRILLLDTFSETSTEVPQTPKYAYTDNEDESEADTASSTTRTAGSTITHNDSGSAHTAARPRLELSWPEVFLLLATFSCCLQLAQSLVGY